MCSYTVIYAEKNCTRYSYVKISKYTNYLHVSGKEKKYFDLKKKTPHIFIKKYLNLKISIFIGFRCVIFVTFT